MNGYRITAFRLDPLEPVFCEHQRLPNDWKGEDSRKRYICSLRAMYTINEKHFCKMHAASVVLDIILQQTDGVIKPAEGKAQ